MFPRFRFLSPIPILLLLAVSCGGTWSARLALRQLQEEEIHTAQSEYLLRQGSSLRIQLSVGRPLTKRDQLAKQGRMLREDRRARLERSSLSGAEHSLRNSCGAPLLL